jgi:biopolymer transport protein ExbB/TolQ
MGRRGGVGGRLDMGDLFGGFAKMWHEGGWGMFPIATAMVFALAIIADRVYTLYFKASMDKDAFLRGLKKHIYAGDLDKAISFTAGQKKTPLVAVIKAGLINVPKSDDDVQAAMDEATLRESPRIERRTGYLAMIGNVATLLGLLGTIVGLIKCFGAVANANPADKAAILSQGISEAMNCTAFGLGVAIPSLVIYSLLQGRTQAMVDDINETAVGVLNLIVANRDKMKMPAAGAAADAEESAA